MLTAPTNVNSASLSTTIGSALSLQSSDCGGHFLHLIDRTSRPNHLASQSEENRSIGRRILLCRSLLTGYPEGLVGPHTIPLFGLLDIIGFKI